jgi:hypothetical protein
MCEKWEYAYYHTMVGHLGSTKLSISEGANHWVESHSLFPCPYLLSPKCCVYWNLPHQQVLPPGVTLTGSVAQGDLAFSQRSGGGPTVAQEVAQHNKFTVPGAWTLLPPDLNKPRHEQERLVVIPMQKSSLLCWSETQVTSCSVSQCVRWPDCCMVAAANLQIT